jgi:hypothetical protein
MQSQTKTNVPVHVKVALNGEFRRFLLTEPTFINLENTVKSLFSLEAPVTLKFLDDEKDWVLLTNDNELLYAIDLAGSPLRVDIHISSGQAPTGVTVTSPAEANPDCGAWRGRGGRRGGRGGCGRGGKNIAERLETKQVRLETKIADLEERLKSSELPSERERTVRWKLARLQEKLEFVTAKRASLASAKPENSTQTETCNEVTDEETTTTQEEAPQGKWRRGRGGRGGCRGGRGEGCKGGIRKLLPPELLEDFQQKKAALKAAKEGGNREEIEACREALWQVKEAKFAAIAALKAERAQANTTA